MYPRGASSLCYVKYNSKGYEKILYLLLLALIPMCFTACGDDWKEINKVYVSVPIEGNWRVKSVAWSYYTKGGSIEPADEVKEYDETTTRGLTITKTGDKFYITSTAPGIRGDYEQAGTNEFKGVGSGDDIYQRLVIVGVSGNVLTAEFYEDYYEIGDGERNEYGLFTFVKM